jgi:hypothetical protein
MISTAVKAQPDLGKAIPAINTRLESRKKEVLESVFFDVIIFWLL